MKIAHSLMMFRFAPLAVLVLVGSLTTPVAKAYGGSSEPADSTLITVLTEPQSRPQVRTDGEVVVWRDAPVAPLGDIWAATLTERAPFRITDDGEHPYEYGPDVSGDIVAWTQIENAIECPNCVGPDVYAKNLMTGERIALADSADEETLVGFAGTWAVWTSRSASTTTLYVQDLSSTDSPRALYSSSIHPDGFQFFMSESSIAWNELHYEGRFSRTWKSFVVSLESEESARVIADGFNTGGVLGLGGNMLIYRVDGFPITIYALDLVTNESRIVDLPESIVAFDGRYAFTLQTEWFTESYQVTLFAHNLMTGATFMVDCDPGLLTGDVHARDGAVVWSRTRDIHGAKISSLLPTAPRPEPDTTDPYRTFYPETGHYLGWGFRDYWEASGGLPVFGYPLTEEFTETNADTGLNHTVQYFERQRFEWHPENHGSPYEVLLGRLGEELLEAQGRDWTTFETADPDAPYYFAETRHAVAPEFWGYWSRHGLDFEDPGVSFRESLALFGYPLSEPLVETNVDGDTVMTQYFERAVFEFHPDNPEPYKVLLRRLGAEMLSDRGWLQ